MLYLKHKNIIDKFKALRVLFVEKFRKMSAIVEPTIALDRANGVMVVTYEGNTLTVTAIDPTHAHFDERVFTYHFNFDDNGLPKSVTVTSNLDPNWEYTYELDWNNSNAKAIEFDPESKSLMTELDSPQSKDKVHVVVREGANEFFLINSNTGNTIMTVNKRQEDFDIKTELKLSPDGDVNIQFMACRILEGGSLQQYIDKKKKTSTPLYVGYMLYLSRDGLQSGNYSIELNRPIGKTGDPKSFEVKCFEPIPARVAITTVTEVKTAPLENKNAETIELMRQLSLARAHIEELTRENSGLTREITRLTQENSGLTRENARLIRAHQGKAHQGKAFKGDTMHPPNPNPQNIRQSTTVPPKPKPCRDCGESWSKGHKCENVIKYTCKRCDMEYTGNVRDHDLNVCTNSLAPLSK